MRTALVGLALTLSLPASGTAQEPAGHEARGDSLMAAFETAAAIEAYRAGLRGRPDDAGLLVKTSRAIGNLALEMPGEEGDEARFEESVDLARRAVEAAPASAGAHAALAAAYGRLAIHRGGRRKVELAREVHEHASRAVELDSSDYRGYIVLGAWNRQVATLNPILRGIAGTFLGGLPDASLERSRAALERAARLAPEVIFTHVELARTYEEMDRDAEARRAIERALALPPREALDRVLQREARALEDELE